jgi:hypothetical protein
MTADARTVRLAFLAVAAVTFLCFAPALRNGLLSWDDAGYILQNVHIHRLDLGTVRWAFGEFYLNYWAPLTWLSLALDWAAWGPNPIGYHLTNVVLHALGAGLFFLVALELLRAHARTAGPSSVAARGAVPTATLAAILFAIHPLRVESVAWATERKDVLSLFFGLLAVLAYLRHAAREPVRGGTPGSVVPTLSRPYALAIAFFVLSLLCKTLLVTLPVILLLLDWFPLRRLERGTAAALLLEKVPFLVLGGLTSAVAMASQSAVIFTFEQIDLATRVLNAFHSVAAYLRLTVWPLDVSPFYVHPWHIERLTPKYGAAIVLVILASAGAVWSRRRWPMLPAAWLVYLVALAPFLGLTQVGPQAMAGRFTYLAGLPVALSLAVGVSAAFQRLAGSRSRTVGLAAVLAAALLALAALTVSEISFWRDDVALWTRVIELQPTTGRAYYERSFAYETRGELRPALADIEEALAIARRKGYRALHELYGARARILARLDELDAAVADYTTALESAGGQARVGLLHERGALLLRQGKSDLAERDLAEALGMTERGGRDEAR